MLDCFASRGTSSTASCNGPSCAEWLGENDDPPQRIGIDETSFQKRHEYVTVVTDLDTRCVLEVATDRNEDSLKGFYEALSVEERSAIKAVAMDMWRPYIKTTRDYVPDAEHKISFDRFHIARHIHDGVNTVRKQEHRELKANGDDRLQNSSG